MPIDGTATLALGGAASEPTANASAFAALAAAVREGLVRPRKRLPAWLLYDRRGSDLFERITELPTYYLTRSERAILTSHAAEMIDTAAPPLAVVELGAGTASKTGLLLTALLARQQRVVYQPVDVSASALAQAAADLAHTRRLTVRPVVARYPEELGFLGQVAGRRLVLFLGSNIGNFNPREARLLLGALRRRLAPGDALLIGADLRKSPRILLPAYDDPQGVTAQFNRNLLVRLNRDLGADFNLERFCHLVRWNQAASRIEIYLQSQAAQRVFISALDLEVPFRAGERIHTESSYKLSRRRLAGLFDRAGLSLERSWYDRRRWFGVHLIRVSSRRSGDVARSARFGPPRPRSLRAGKATLRSY